MCVVMCVEFFFTTATKRVSVYVCLCVCVGGGGGGSVAMGYLSMIRLEQVKLS